MKSGRTPSGYKIGELLSVKKQPREECRVVDVRQGDVLGSRCAAIFRRALLCRRQLDDVRRLLKLLRGQDISSQVGHDESTEDQADRIAGDQNERADLDRIPQPGGVASDHERPLRSREALGHLVPNDQMELMHVADAQDGDLKCECRDGTRQRKTGRIEQVLNGIHVSSLPCGCEQNCSFEDLEI